MHQILGNVIIIYSEDHKQWFIAEAKQPENEEYGENLIIGYGNTKEEALVMAVENISVSHKKKEKLIEKIRDLMELDTLAKTSSEMDYKEFQCEGLYNDGHGDYFNVIFESKGEYFVGRC